MKHLDFTNEELAEMELLKNDEAVKLAKKRLNAERRDLYKDRQKLYQLRYLKKKGKMLLNQ